MKNLINKLEGLGCLEIDIVERVVNYFDNPLKSSENEADIVYELIQLLCGYIVEDVVELIKEINKKALNEQKNNIKVKDSFSNRLFNDKKIDNSLISPVSKNYNLDKNTALNICKKYDVSVSKHVTFANLSRLLDGRYPANVNLNYLDNEWTIVLNDGFKKELHILRIPANSFHYNDFYIRTDRNLIVLSIDKNFVDIHKLQGIENRFFEYKTKTISYSDEDIID